MIACWPANSKSSLKKARDRAVKDSPLKRTGARPSGATHGDVRRIHEACELIWLSFTQQAGREQAGRRPALVLSGNQSLATILEIAAPLAPSIAAMVTWVALLVLKEATAIWTLKLLEL